VKKKIFFESILIFAGKEGGNPPPEIETISGGGIYPNVKEEN
jgi:hypothetical protein